MSSACSVELLRSAVTGRLPLENEIALARHLDECATCSDALDGMVRWTDWCEEAPSLLTKDELDEVSQTHGECLLDFTVEHLAPSDRAGALGRLGEFEILEVIGRGGMGVVLKGVDGK